MQEPVTNTLISPPVPRAAINRRQSAAGFTLIELLVVLVIIGLTVTMAVISLGGDSLEEMADEEMRRFAELTRLAGEQAVLEGREYGIRFTEEGYLFMRLQDERWQAIEDDRLLRPRELPAGLTLLPYVESRAANTDARETPQLLLLSSGERTPFELRLYDPEQRELGRVQAETFGDISIDRDPS
jgi:general secretion pathway protein H